MSNISRCVNGRGLIDTHMRIACRTPHHTPCDEASVKGYLNETRGRAR